MAEQENLQQKNRVIYNVQDLFFGLVSGEYNSPYVSGDNHQDVEVLKRIHRVQSVSYDFQVKRQNIGVLGKASFDENLVVEPPDINVTISYSLEGLNNERKMGFNVLSFDAHALAEKEFTNTFLSGNHQQNIYLAVNQGDDDILETVRDPFEISQLINSGRYREIAHENTDKMGLIVFQNCRATNYSIDISVGGLPQADVSFVSDNAIYLNSASGQFVPWLDTKTAKVYNKKNNKGTDTEFLVPGNYSRENPNFNPNYTFKPGDCHLTVETRPSPDDIVISRDFEDGGELNDYKGVQSNDSAVSCFGAKSLKVVAGPGVGATGGVRMDLPDNGMSANEYYTIDAYIRTNSTEAITVFFDFRNEEAITAEKSNLSTFKNIRAVDGCSRVKKRVKLDKVKNYCYIYTKSPNVTFWLDNVRIDKDAENPPLKFHTNLMQSFKLNVPLNRENISCLGYKYYENRPVALPVKTDFSIDMTSQDKEFPVEASVSGSRGNFMDNLTKDEEYDLYLTFTDDNLKTGMRYRLFGAKFEGVNYGLDVGSPKSTSLGFSISNDYDFERSVITAEGKGLFVLDFLVSDSLVNLTDDNGEYLADPWPHNF